MPLCIEKGFPCHIKEGDEEEEDCCAGKDEAKADNSAAGDSGASAILADNSYGSLSDEELDALS